MNVSYHTARVQVAVLDKQRSDDTSVTTIHVHLGMIPLISEGAEKVLPNEGRNDVGFP